jgi:ubiquinone/menaquinone biosynthesis C-methylase UbiE
VSLHSVPRNIHHPLNVVGAYGLAVMRATFTAMLTSAGIGLEGKRILDLGCGTGSWTRFMAELKSDPADIVGLDQSADRIALSRKMSPQGTRYI